MKTIKWILVLLFFSTIAAKAQTDTLRIKTSAVCEKCKATLENDISFEKGVKWVHLDIPTAILTVVYVPGKNTPEKIRLAVTKTGYDADSLKADPKAFDKLSECCKKPHGE
ncbi:MAG: heavy-metal-associated domain-containing protein [Bacteroidia bacterium]